MTSDTQALIAAECDALKAMLLAKNQAYGDSAIRPLRIFSKASSVEQILVRLDDKISRLARGTASGDDVIQDLVGYLVLLRVAQRIESEWARRTGIMAATIRARIELGWSEERSVSVHR